MTIYKTTSLTLGSATLDWGQRTYIMGIVNTTPDSFSGDGLLHDTHDLVEAAVKQATAQVAAGAHLIDIGGESSRPGSTPISLEEELERTIPVVRAVTCEVTVPISIDTYKAEVARQAIEAGATLVNDIWGLQMDAQMAQVVAQAGVGIVLMHNRSKPKDAVQEARLGGRYVGVQYHDLMGDILRELQQSINFALNAGIAPEKIIVDPGIGFGKTIEQNLELIARLAEVKSLGYPILVGPSRKSFIGHVLDLPPEERVEGTAAAVTLCIDRGAAIVRVHDVGVMSRVAKLTDAVVRKR